MRAAVVVRGDSKLVIEQLQGRWRVRGGRYVPIYKEAKARLDHLRKLLVGSRIRKAIKFQWLPREKNEICDVLSKAQLKTRGVVFRIQPEA